VILKNKKASIIL